MRFWGEEFVFLLPSTAPERADEFGEVARSEIARMRLTHEGCGAGWLTASVGVASVVPDGGLDPVAVAREADEALYDVKRSERDRHKASHHGAGCSASSERLSRERHASGLTGPGRA